MSEQLSPDVLTRVQSLANELERWRKKIEQSLNHAGNTHDFNDIVNMVMANRLLFFSWPECFALMEINEYPKFKVFHGFIAGGSIEALLEVQQQLENVGKRYGCKFMTISGREGWEKVLPKAGWKKLCTTMVTEIGGSEDV